MARPGGYSEDSAAREVETGTAAHGGTEGPHLSGGLSKSLQRARRAQGVAGNGYLTPFQE